MRLLKQRSIAQLSETLEMFRAKNATHASSIAIINAGSDTAGSLAKCDADSRAYTDSVFDNVDLSQINTNRDDIADIQSYLQGNMDYYVKGKIIHEGDNKTNSVNYNLGVTTAGIKELSDGITIDLDALPEDDGVKLLPENTLIGTLYKLKSVNETVSDTLGVENHPGVTVTKLEAVTFTNGVCNIAFGIKGNQSISEFCRDQTGYGIYGTADVSSKDGETMSNLRFNRNRAEDDNGDADYVVLYVPVGGTTVTLKNDRDDDITIEPGKFYIFSYFPEDDGGDGDGDRHVDDDSTTSIDDVGRTQLEDTALKTYVRDLEEPYYAPGDVYVPRFTSQDTKSVVGKITRLLNNAPANMDTLLELKNGLDDGSINLSEVDTANTDMRNDVQGQIDTLNSNVEQFKTDKEQAVSDLISQRGTDVNGMVANISSASDSKYGAIADALVGFDGDTARSNLGILSTGETLDTINSANPVFKIEELTVDAGKITLPTSVYPRHIKQLVVLYAGGEYDVLVVRPGDNLGEYKIFDQSEGDLDGANILVRYVEVKDAVLP